MKQMKKTVLLLMAFILSLGFCGCAQSASSITIPDVEKLDVDTAKSLLTDKGLIPKLEYELNEKYDDGTVIRTAPAIGSEVSKDTVITLYVCKDDRGQKVVIPDVDGLDVDTAKTLLAGKGLVPKIEYEYVNDYEYDEVFKTNPAIGSEVYEEEIVTLYVCKGPKYYALSNALAWFSNVEGINDFVWNSEATDGEGTKGFYAPYAKEGYLYIDMYLMCKSVYSIEFYKDFGTASINDTFDKTVPITVIYDSAVVNNKGERTDFTLKIPLTDLGVQKPTNLTVEFDFLVNGVRKDFTVGFDLTW